MKKIKVVLTIFGLMLGVIFGGLSLAQAVTVQINAPDTASVGGTVTAIIEVNNPNYSAPLGGIEFILEYDPAVLEVTRDPALVHPAQNPLGLKVESGTLTDSGTHAITANNNLAWGPGNLYATLRRNSGGVPPTVPLVGSLAKVTFNVIGSSMSQSYLRLPCDGSCNPLPCKDITIIYHPISEVPVTCTNNLAASDMVTVGTNLNKPTNLTAAPASSSAINLAWEDNSNNETGFIIQRKGPGETVYTQVATVVANVKSYQNTGLSPLSTYSYQVAAFNAQGRSEYSNVTSATTPDVPPTTPTGLVATTVSDSRIDVNWNDASDNEQGFKIERRTVSTAYTQIATVPAGTTSYNDTNLAPATTYYYRVRAYNAQGDSTYSNEGPATTGNIPPAAPSVLTATGISSSQINLAWQDKSGNEDGFKIERKQGAAGTYSQIAILGANTISHQDSGLLPDTTYYYRVKAYNVKGDSLYSNEAPGTTKDVPPLPPTGLTATAVSSTQVNLGWQDNSANEDNFYIERKEGQTGTYSQINIVAAGITTYSNAGLSPSTTYYYRVRAWNEDGFSSYSNEAGVLTLPPVAVSISVPAGAVKGAAFTGSVNVDAVNNFDAGLFIIHFDPKVLHVLAITSGSLTGSASPTVNIDNINGLCNVLINLPGTTGVSGSGSLVKIEFQAVGDFGRGTDLTLSDLLLSNGLAQEIPAAFVGPVHVNIRPGPPQNLKADGSSPSPWKNTATFLITWNSPVGPAIAGAWYKAGSAPTSNTDGVFMSGANGSFNALATAEGGQPIYVWLQDLNGGKDFNQNSSVVLRYDRISPTLPVVTDDGAVTTNPHRLHAAWTSQDASSGVAEYRYGLGTARGEVDVLDWSSAGLSTEVTLQNLNLTMAAYYFAVKAGDIAGNWSQAGTSDGILVDTSTIPYVQVISPNGGEYVQGVLPIRWTADMPGVSNLKITIKYSVDGGNNWPVIATNEANDGLYNWSTSYAGDGRNYLIRVEATAGAVMGYDISNAVFTIDNFPHTPVVNVTSPNGGEYWQGTQDITWTAADGDGDPVTIDIYYGLGGQGWTLIAAGEVNDGRFPWNTLSVADGTNYLIKVVAKDVSPVEGYDVSNAPFTIDNAAHGPQVTVSSPNGGEKLNGIQWIRWAAYDEDGDPLSITIQYLMDGVPFTLASREINDGLYAWDTRLVADGAGYRIRVVANDGSPNPGQDDSDAGFKVDNFPHAPVVQVTSPDGGENWSGNRNITWRATDADAEDPDTSLAIDIEYSPNGGDSWFYLAQNAANTGQWLWNTATVLNGTNYLVRVTARDGNTIGQDRSAGGFKVNNDNHTPTVDILYPLGGETLKEIVQIRWQAQDLDGDSLKVTIWVDGDTIAANLANVGVFNWDTTKKADGNYSIRIVVNDGGSFPPVPTGEDQSGQFAIDNDYAPVVQLTSPRGGETWNGPRNITWTASDPDSGVLTITLDYRVDGKWYALPFDRVNDGIHSWNTASVGDAGNYIIRIKATDAGGLAGEAVSGGFTIDNDTHTPTIRLISPLGGEIWSGTKEIKWEGNDFDPQDSLIVKIEKSADDGATWYPVSNNEPNDGVYVWNTTTVADAQKFKIRLTISDGSDTAVVTSGAFKIDNIPHSPTAKVRFPNGGETLQGVQPISWQADDIDQDPLKIDLYLSKDSGLTWTLLAADLTNNNGSFGSFNWDTTQGADGVYLIKVKARDDTGRSGEDISDGSVTIDNPSAPNVILTSPNGGEKLRGNAAITWQASDNDGDTVGIDLLYSYDATAWMTIALNELNDGTYTWNTTNLPDRNDYLVKVRGRDPSQRSGEDTSDAVFMIDNVPYPPVVTVSSPSQGQTIAGSTTITWNASDTDGDAVTVSIAYSHDGGTAWTTIAEGEANDGSYNWDTTGLPDGEYLIRITADDEDTASGTGSVISAGFNIDNPKPPQITLTAPNGGEIWSGIRDITWTATDPDGDTLSIDILISPDNGNNWSILAASETNDGVFSRNLDFLADGSNFLIQVRAADGVYTVSDVSDAVFTIGHLVGPDGATLYEGSRVRAVFEAGDVSDELIILINNESEITTDWVSVNNINPIPGTVWEYAAYWKSTGETFTGNFDSLVEIRMPYQDTNGDRIVDGTNVPVDELQIYRLNENEAVWETIEDGGAEVIDRREKEVKTGIIHFSIYCLAGNPPGTPQVTLLSPSMVDEYWWGNREIRWQAVDPDGAPLTIKIEYQVTTAVGEPNKWYSIAEGEPNDGLYVWNTWTVADGQHYIIRVSASDGALVGYAKSENLIIDNNPHTPHVRVVSPNGGEVLRDSGFPPAYSSIRWTAGDEDGDPLVFTLEYSVDNGYHWYKIVSGAQNDVTIFTVEDNVYSYSWDTSTVADGQNYLVRVVASDPSPRSSWDASDRVFTIDNSENGPVVKILLPEGGESLKGTSYIKWEAWDSDGDVLTITIQSSIDGETWYTIAGNERNDGAYRWDTRAMADGDNYFIKVMASDGKQTGKDQLKTPIRIDNQPFAPVVKLLSPNGREYWQGVQNIEWTAGDVDGGTLTYTVSCSPDRGGHWYKISPLDITEEEAGRFSAPWDTKTVPDGINYLIKVEAADEGGLTGRDQSNQTFMIDNNPAAPPHAPQIKITAPSGGENWAEAANITWQATDLDGDPLSIDILARRVGTTDWITIASGESNDGIFTWNTTRVSDGKYEIMARVTDGYATMESNPPYPQVNIDNLHPPVVTIITPQAGDQWTDQTGGFLKTINWVATDPDAGDQLTFDCYYRIADSDFWWEMPDAKGLSGQTTTMDIRTVEDGLSYQIKVVAKDGTGLVGEGLSGVFTIDNNPNGPVIELLSPDGGEYWSGSRLIRWIAEDGDGEKITIDLACSVDGGKNWHTIVTGLENDGVYNWDTKTVADGVKYLIQVTAKDESNQTATDRSMAVFKIDNFPNAPVVRVISPNGITNGVRDLPWKNTVTIQWHASDADNDELTITLLYSDDAGPSRPGGAGWHIIASGLENTGVYDWSTNDLPDGIHYLVKVVASDANLGREDVSDATFEIDNRHAPEVTVLSPNGGEVIKGSYEIRWTATDVDTEDQITISLSYKGNGVSNWAPIPGGEKLANTTGRFVWDTTQLPGNGLDYLIKIVATDSSGLKGEDVSNKVFTIDVPDAPVVKLISPAGSETWAGLKQIEWKASDPDGDRLLINIAYSINDGIAWNNIISNLENTSRFLWDTSRVKDNPNCRLRVQASDGALIGEAVSPVLQIDNPDVPVVELISPNGGEDWHGRQKIEWYVNDPDAADILLVTVEFSFNNGRHWYKLLEEERSSGGGSFYWETTTVENGTNYLVRITAFDGSHRVNDQSEAPFRIDNNWHQPTIKLLSPKGGEVYSGQEAILWKASDLDGDKLKINIYYGRISEATGTVEAWYPLSPGEANDGYYAWDTTSVPDGVRYKIKVVADDEDDNSEVGEDQSATAFTVDNDPHIPVIRLTSPKAGEAYGDAHKLSSRIQIEWELEDVDNRVDSFKIEYSYDGGRSWIIEKDAGADNSAFSPPPAVSGIYKYNWETKDLPDDDYLVRVTVNDGHMMNNDRTEGSFAIDNRHAPTATLISPNGGENLRGEVAIRWQASDIDPGDTVYITIAYSRNSGSTWLPLATGEDNDGEYLWDTTRVQEARTYLIRVSASDGILYSTDQSDEVFTVDNTLPNIVRISPADGTAINAAKPLPAKVDAFLTNGVSGIDEEHSQLIITRNGGDYLDQGSIDRSQPDHLIFTPANGFDDGIYEVTVTPVDSAGLIGDTKVSTFIIDQTAPLMTALDSSSPEHGDSIKPENREIIVKVVEQMEMDTASLTLNYKIYSGDQPPAGGTMTTLMTRSGKASLWTFKATLPLKDKGAANGEKVDYWITGKDRAGNPLKSSLSPSLIQEDGKATLFIDEEPPVSESITINGGDRAAKDRLVTVALNVSGTPSRMMISEYPNFAEARWEDYVSSLTRKLSMGDGDKTIYVRYMDAATNVSASDSASIILDTFSPTAAIDAPADGAFLNQANISIKGTADDASGIAEVGIQINGGSWVKATGTTSWSYAWSPGQDGSYNLKVRAVDLAGNQKESETRKLHVDRTAPVPLSIAINSGAEYTRDREVSLSSTVEGYPAWIKLSEEPNFTGANWRTYTSTVSFTLTSGDGKKVVYAKYSDEAGNESDTLAASIILDTTGPDVQITAPAAGTTVGGEVVNITGGAQDNLSGVELVQVSLDGGSSWIGVSGTGSWTYQWNPVKEGTVGLQARGKDKAGNFGLSPTISIQVDKTGPVPVSMKINSDQEATNSREATVALNVTGNPAQVRLSESKDFSGASWRSYTAELAFQLSSGDGMKTVYAQIKDVVGNLSQPISDQILLDTAAPTGAGIKINAGAEITNSPRLNLTLKVEGATRMMISEDGLFDSEKWELFASSREWPLSNTADGLKPLRVKFRDEAGNETDPVSDWIELDQTPPEVEISSPQAGIKVGGDGVPIKVPVDGNERVNLFYRWDHEEKGWQNIAVLDSPPYAAWWDTSKLGDGEYQLKAEGWDKAGNVAVSTITLVVDHQNPDLESNKVVPGESQFMEFSSGVSLEIPAYSLPGSTAAITLSDSDGLRNLGVDVSAIDAANQAAMEDVTLGIIPSSEECRLMLYDGGGNPLSIPFNQALDIALPYPDANQDGLVDGTNFPVSTLKVFRLESDRWEEVGSDQARGGLVWAGVNQTGVYTLMSRRATPAKSLRDVKVYPNPFRPGKAVQGAVKFINLRNDNEIRIYALSGELIKVIGTDKLSTLFYGGQVYYGATWNGTNESGDEVATGVYLYVIKGGGDKSGKLSVIR